MLNFIKKHYSLLSLTFLVSLILHYLFVMYFPINWFERMGFSGSQWQGKGISANKPLNIELLDAMKDGEDGDSNKEGDGKGEGGEGLGQGLDKDKWGDLLDRLEENTGFESNFTQTYEDLIPNSKVSSSYIHRDRHNEDIVVKEVFPTIYSIDKPFEDVLKAAPENLDEYEERNEIIEQYRSQQSNEQSQLIVQLPSKDKQGNLGPLHFPPEERQKFFDSTLTEGKTEQLSEFIQKYFQYDPNEGDLPIATRELYLKNLERILYTFSSDQSYFYLDFYLENLNKEDFLNNALYQASRLDGTKTATELLFSIERIYEIQQRAWASYFDFEKLYKNLPADKKNRLRVETLRRVDERYKKVLEKKGVKDFDDIEKKYLQRRYEIIDHIVKNTPENYRLQDAKFEQAVILWQMGLDFDDETKKQQAVNIWQSLIDEAKRKNYSENAYNDFENLKHLRMMDALLSVYENEQGSRKVQREKQITSYLMQRQSKRLNTKREREEQLLWPEK